MLEGSIKRHLKLAAPAYVLVIVMMIAASFVSPKFLTANNLKNIVSQATTLATVSIGQTIVLLLGGIDLSVGSTVSLGTVIIAKLSSIGGIGIPLSILAALTAGALIGAVNGVGIVRFKVPPMIMTISTSSLVKGVSLLWMPKSGGEVSMGMMEFFTKRFGILTVSSMLMLACYGAMFFLLHGTRPGRKAYATGNDENHARQSGICTERVIAGGYVISGVFAALAGVLLAMRIFSGDALVGDAYSMDSVASAVIGGISLSGGIGSVAGTLAGAFALGMINNVMNMMKVYAYYQYIIKGAILVFALLVFRLKRRGKA